MKGRPNKPARESMTRPGRWLLLLSAGLFLAAGVIAEIGCSTRTDPKQRPNILIITLDTTRVDHVGFYGYKRPTTPVLDKLAKSSVVFAHAYSTASWTLPAHASLFTSLFTKSHGARYDPEGPLFLTAAIENAPPDWSRLRARALDPEAKTLANVLREKGYATAAFVAGPWLKRVFGLDAGFDFYDDRGIKEINGRFAEEVTDSALSWLDKTKDKPFFVFLNYFDAHGPYQPPVDMGSKFLSYVSQERLKSGEATLEQKIALYDAEIATVDRSIGRLFRQLEKQGRMNDTWIVVAADHGELFGEHRLMGHGISLSEQEIHIPLLIRPPHGSTWTAPAEQPVQLVDIMPTLLANLGIPAPPETQGGVIPENSHPIVAEFYPVPYLNRGGTWRAIVADGWKLVEHEGEPLQLFDLTKDPGENHNLFDASLERGYAMLGRLDDYMRKLPTPSTTTTSPVEVEASTQRALEALGYLEKHVDPKDEKPAQ